MARTHLSDAGASMRTLAWFIAVPALLAAVGLAILGARSAAAPPPHDGSPDEALAEAIYQGEVEDAFDVIHGGRDPNAPLRFQHPDVTDDREVMVSPLMLAVANNRDNVVTMLLNFGVRMDLPQNRRALCLAKQIHADEVAAILMRHGAAGVDTNCPATPPRARAPVLDYVN